MFGAALNSKNITWKSNELNMLRFLLKVAKRISCTITKKTRSKGGYFFSYVGSDV